jgi:putative colanic acid biosynthesis acetyltransferase WcaF
MAWLLLYRPSPRRFHAWRRFLLRLFGARVGPGAHPYPAARVWAPWNLEMQAGSCLSDFVDCYCVDRITLGVDCVVSQYSFLCSASHDADDPGFPLVTAPIEIGARAWVAADAFVGPGVTVGEGAVVGARASVFADVAPWTVVGGNPAALIRHRKRADRD